jgi:hypothetical protein
MALPETAKPATAETVNGLRNLEQLAGQIDLTDSKIAEHLQVSRLVRRHAISISSAYALAPHVFGEAMS